MNNCSIIEADAADEWEHRHLLGGKLNEICLADQQDLSGGMHIEYMYVYMYVNMYNYIMHAIKN